MSEIVLMIVPFSKIGITPHSLLCRQFVTLCCSSSISASSLLLNSSFSSKHIHSKLLYWACPGDIS